MREHQRLTVTPSRPWSVGVVIPARNEQDTITACLDSLMAAARQCASQARVCIVVAADGCTDATAARAAAVLNKQGATAGEVITCAASSPGEARRRGTAAVLRHFAAIAPQCIWLANTDADTLVPADWLLRQLRLADGGVAAVAGVVQVDAIVGHSTGNGDALARRLLADYAIHADGTHPHVHGANLGVRADAYLDTGGWRDLAVSEDHCLWNRLRARGWPLASPADCVVTTSGRLVGRACGGFADLLRNRLEALHGCA